MQIQAGDILLYRAANDGRGVEQFDGSAESIEGNNKARAYDHVAIALEADRKVESNTNKVEIAPISGERFELYRPPLTEQQIQTGLKAVMILVGQAYDWWLIADEVLRDLSDHMIHFDESFIHGKEEPDKICSTLVSYYFLRAGWGNARAWPKPSIADIWRVVRDCEIAYSHGCCR